MKYKTNSEGNDHTMQTCIGVLADDLTGSMDAGVQLLNQGYTVRIALSANAVESIAKDTDIIVLNSESRNIPVAQAGEYVKKCVGKLKENGCRLVYKKIDSTLRGNIGGELEATLLSSGADCILLAPALPFHQRTTVNGVHYVGGIRLQDTELARDPFSPIFTSDIREIIHTQTNLPTQCLKIEVIRDCVASCQQALESMLADGVKIIVCDAIDDGDLTCIARAAERLPQTIVFCGSAGLFRYLANTGRVAPPLSFQSPVMPKWGNGCILVLSGSPASASKKQLDYVKASEREGVISISANLERLNSNETNRKAETAFLIAQVEKGFAEGNHVILDTAGVSKSKLLYCANTGRDKLNADSANIQRLLADIAVHCAKRKELSGLVLFGGDTALSVAKALSAKGIQILSQVEPYVPMGRFIGSVCDHIPVVTKAGGFGTETTLSNILQQLESQQTEIVN